MVHISHLSSLLNGHKNDSVQFCDVDTNQTSFLNNLPCSLALCPPWSPPTTTSEPVPAFAKLGLAASSPGGKTAAVEPVRDSPGPATTSTEGVEGPEKEVQNDNL